MAIKRFPENNYDYLIALPEFNRIDLIRSVAQRLFVGGEHIRRLCKKFKLNKKSSGNAS